ncbi:ATP-dependent metallopeptidase FtsH/Yme1/Tma family protein [Gloeocapsopsis dulcis]|uniref:ATP-dependent metallopeptidase FtsH/Yme1/Tma family protein n=1 Tax=Gloeocapsopsis dulcis TaxID=2859516 RepID=UPI001F286A05|nr:ATP-dependent metallopeptidase FtsH/Yme1/Tma family protein [Gloeocapsopsis dulcis]WNN90219.1 hypothetical protein P0S91_03720 [Gloeocapsopsis dulcis]
MPVETNNNKRSKKPPQARQFGGSLLILFTILLLLNFIVPSLGAPLPQVPYSDFITQVEADQVERAIVGSDRFFEGDHFFLLNLLYPVAGFSAVNRFRENY